MHREGPINSLDAQGGPYERFGRLEKEKHLLCLPEIEPQCFSGPAQSLVAKLTELYMI